jgi:glycosidase
MSAWPRYPTLYEINTWVWLGELERKYRNPVKLSSVPPSEWDALATLGFDAIWFMGVWERSPAGIAIANRNPDLLCDFRRALPDFQMSDNVGSPYCVRSYVADRHLGGPDGLAVARRELASRGMRLVLDFVPNHVAPDHPWVVQHPEYFIQGSEHDALSNPNSYIEVQGKYFACGRDPYFPAWPDVVQLNAFHPGVRQAVLETVADIASQCDGVRCDMAMLLLNSVFPRTWGDRAGPRPQTEYWDDLIPSVKKNRPDFIFIAEAYWDLEWELQQRGFDFCYDKRLYDRLEHDTAESIRLHLCADLAYQEKLLRFLENHDEPRAASAFAGAKEKAAAIVTATLPGARLFHEGQFGGRNVRLPVFLSRRPAEPLNEDLRAFYGKLLAAINSPVFRDGKWQLCERSGWPDNPSFLNLVAWSWTGNDERYLVVVNLSAATSQAQVAAPWPDGAGKTWQLIDVLSGVQYERSGSEMLSAGLFVELGPWGHNFFRCRLGE